MGDKIFTTDQIEMVSGRDMNYTDPVTYDKEPAPEARWSEKRLYDIDYLSFGSKIGFVTNCSTYWYSLRSNYQKGTPQYEELTKRLIWSRYSQGQNIDKTKGISCEPSPKEWIKNTDKSTDVDKELVVCRKPYFQKYIYSRLNNEYKEWQVKIERYSIAYYGLDAGANKNPDFVKMCNETCPVLDNNSVMNRICHYMESHIKEVKTVRKDFSQIQLDGIMMNNYRELRLDKESYMRNCLGRYKELRQSYRENTKFVSREEKANERQQFYMYCNILRDEIVMQFDGVAVDAANMAIYVGYDNNVQENREFAWELFGKEIFNNVKSNRQENVYIPELDPNGDIEYLGMRYSRKKVD